MRRSKTSSRRRDLRDTTECRWTRREEDYVVAGWARESVAVPRTAGAENDTKEDEAKGQGRGKQRRKQDTAKLARKALLHAGRDEAENVGRERKKGVGTGMMEETGGTTAAEQTQHQQTA
ncbi:hypothetical protein ColTof4_12112 [Colletotrichum tofieldiae]|nr:hypothetical protein ColTof3_05525 [Colletotrichum tofieldiae]GKT79689.1 hypothetical protein ColTof4_12112 [Colletotrichum tofieldiae]GKT84262.1 hypothetical protein Ct61P_02112 [Colletotrichum tofieldiae]